MPTRNQLLRRVISNLSSAGYRLTTPMVTGLLQRAGGLPVYATSRVDNMRTHASLEHCGFRKQREHLTAQSIEKSMSDSSCVMSTRRCPPPRGPVALSLAANRFHRRCPTRRCGGIAEFKWHDPPGRRCTHMVRVTRASPLTISPPARAVSQFTAQIRQSRANIRWSRPESVSSLLN